MLYSDVAEMPVKKVPCKACPFRKTSVPGFLGGGPNQLAEDYAEWAKSDHLISCHKSPGYNETDASRTRPCAGAAIYRNNILKLPRHPVAQRACQQVGPDDDGVVFKTQQEFLDRHATELNKRFAASMKDFAR